MTTLPAKTFENTLLFIDDFRDLSISRQNTLGNELFSYLMKKYSGFNLIELIVTMSVALIIMALAVPGFRNTTDSNRMANQINQILRALNYSRSTAVTRGTPTTLCQVNTACTQCLASPTWENGWTVFSDINGDGFVDDVNADTNFNCTDLNLSTIDVFSQLGGGNSLSFAGNRVTYATTGYTMGTSGTFTLCDNRGAPYAKAVVVSSTGRPKKSTTDGNGNALTCP